VTTSNSGPRAGASKHLGAAVAVALLLTPLAALLGPGVASSPAGMLLWTPPLVPIFLLGLHRGWVGAAHGLALALGAVALAGVTGALSGSPVADIAGLLGLAGAYGVVALGTGFVSEHLHEARLAAEEVALTDELTGLPNRRHAEIFLDAAVASAERGIPMTVVLFDLDHFKRVNDTLGHQAGDDALRIVADVLRSCTRKSNLSARIGGEEFLVILSNCNLHGGMIFAERFRTVLKERAQALGLTVSAGVATFQPGCGSREALIAAADEALYEAKASGRDCVRASSTLIAPIRRGVAAA